MTRRREGRALRSVRLLALPAVGLGTALPAQVVERHLPPAQSQGVPAVAPAPLAPTVADATSIGPPLRGLVLLDAEDPIRPPVQGVVATSGLRLKPATVTRLLSPFLGRPLSRQLIVDVEAAVTRAYRRTGFPFLSVTTPAQDIGTGTLQLRIVEFRVGAVTTSGLRRTPSDRVTSRIRLRSGDPIDANHLSEDLDWLNRDPFRQISPVFSPGASMGATDVSLVATEQARPWRLYGGAQTSGAVATGHARVFAGVQVAGPRWLPDAVFSYQFTGAPDAFTRQHPDYVSHAVRATLPVASRSAIELTYDHVETSQPVQDFVSRQRIDEASLGWHGALTALVPQISSSTLVDLDVGAEVRHAHRQLRFGGTAVDGATVDVFQLYTGLTASRADAHGTTQLGITVHVSPGGFGRRGDDEDYARFTGRASASAEYAYVNGSASRVQRLTAGLSLSSQLLFQYAGKALPDTEQIALGGPSAVRGYVIDDGGYDSAVIARNQLNGPTIALSRRGSAATIQPLVFVDAGHGVNHAGRFAATLVSTGAGIDAAFGRAVQASGDVACALRDASFSAARHCRVEARISLAL